MSDPPKSSSLGSLGALSAVGIAFVLAVVFGFLIGYLLDRWLGTSPLFLILFFFIGVAAGITNVIRTANAVTEEEKKALREGQAAGETEKTAVKQDPLRREDKRR